MIGQLLDVIDACFAVLLTDTARIVVWAVLVGAGSMWIYAAASPQRRIKELEKESAEARAALAGYDGDFAGAWPLIRRSLAAPLRRLCLALRPSLLAGVPVIVVLVWIDDRYGDAPPRPGETVAVEVLPATLAANWTPDGAAVAEANGEWLVRWPEADRPVRLVDSTGAELLTFPGTAAATVSRPSWWQRLFSSRIGTLPAGSPIEAVNVHYPQRDVLGFGPSWARSFLTVFLVATCLSSLTVKYVFRIA